MGLCSVDGLGETGWARIHEARQQRSFDDLSDFCQRTRLPVALVRNLIRAGRLGKRRNLLWQVDGLDYRAEALLREPTDGTALPPLAEEEATAWEYELLGLSPGGHLLAQRLPTAGGITFLSLEDDGPSARTVSEDRQRQALHP